MSDYLGLFLFVLACFSFHLGAWLMKVLVTRPLDHHLDLQIKNKEQLILLTKCYPIIREHAQIAALSESENEPDTTHSFVVHDAHGLYAVENELRLTLLKEKAEN